MEQQTMKLLGAVLVVGLIAGGISGMITTSLMLPDDEAKSEQTFTLVAYISGYEGEGGEIDGMTNPTLNVKANSEITIILKAGESTPHDFKIEDIVDTELIAQDSDQYEDQVTVTFTVGEGEFIYFCSVAGHRATMEGSILAGDVETPDEAKPVDVDSISRDPTDVGTPVGDRNTTKDIEYTIESKEVVAEIEPGVTFTYWTYNSTVPGPLIRAMVGDNITITLQNSADSTQEHSIDLHAVTGPGGGAQAKVGDEDAILRADPGNSSSYSFIAKHEGTFVYHCASPHIPTHISKGMYGAVVIEPVGGLPEVDQELFVAQNEVYTKYDAGIKGHQEFDSEAQEDEEPTYVNFNGAYNALTGNNSITVNQNDDVRIFFGVGGPNLISSFHLIGEVWDKVWYETNYTSGPNMYSAETVLVAPGSVLTVELTMETLGNYILVDHALSRTFDKGALGIISVV